MSRKIAMALALLLATASTVAAIYIWTQPRPITTFKAGILPMFYVVDDELVVVLGTHGEFYTLSKEDELNQIELSEEFDFLGGTIPLYINHSHYYGHMQTSFFSVNIKTGDMKIEEYQGPDVSSTPSVSLEPVYGIDGASVFTWTAQNPNHWIPAPAFGKEHEEDAYRFALDQDKTRFLEMVIYNSPGSNKTDNSELRLWDTTDPSNPILVKEVAMDIEGDGILLDDGRIAWSDQDTLTIWDPETDSTSETLVGPNAAHRVYQLPDGTIIASGYQYFEGSDLSNRDPETKFFSPNTLEEIKSVEGLKIIKVEPWGDDKLIAIVSREKTSLGYPAIEIWHADEFVDGLES